MKNATPQVGRPRTITTEKLDSLMNAAKKMNGSLTKACRSQHKNYQSVLNAANTLGHPIKALVKVYAPRKKKTQPAAV